MSVPDVVELMAENEALKKEVMARTGVYGFLSILRAENAQLRSSLDGARKVIEYGVQAVDTDYINHNRAGLSNWYQVASAYIASHPKDGEK